MRRLRLPLHRPEPHFTEESGLDRQTPPPPIASHSRRHLLRPAYWLCLALSAHQLSTVADGLLPFPPAPPARHLASTLHGRLASRRAAARWSPPRSKRGHHGQPECE